MHSVRRILVLGTAVLFSPFLTIAAQDQQPAEPSSSSGDSGAKTTAREASKPKHADDFLVRGTVFSPEGLSFPGAEIRIRRGSEKKFRWQAQTNSRGEFAIRVKQGSKYEVVIRAKGFKEQSKSVDATSNAKVEEMTLRMERERGSKP